MKRRILMKIKAKLVTCIHESKYRTDTFTRLVKKNEHLDTVIKEIMDEADYDGNNINEYFNTQISEIIIDTDDYEIVE